MQKLERNIKIYGFLKIFTKRVFLPLTAIYFVEVGGLTIAQIGLLATVSAVVSLIAEVPTGYFSDRITRRASLTLAGFFAAIGTLFFAFMPSIEGAIIGTIFEALGYAFLSGAGEALIHDTLVKLDRDEDYPKVAGRAQSLGLAGNTVLIALVPLTYAINPKIPFLCGTIAYLTLIGLARYLVEPPRVEGFVAHKSMYASLRVFVNRYTFVLFIAIGVLSGLHNSSSDFTNLAFRDLGMDPSRLGFIFAGASIVGIIAGFFVHLLKNWSLLKYCLFDLLTFCGFMAVIGITKNLTLSIIYFMFYMGFWRLRQIMYQHHLLKMFGKNNRYKATLISTLMFFVRANEIWIPFVFVAGISAYGYYQGFLIISIVSLIVLAPLFVLATKLVAGHKAEIN